MEHNNMNLSEEQNNHEIETVEVIEVLDIETYEVDSDVAFPSLGEANEKLKHQLLNGKELSDQHPITAITGLREELDSIEALQTIYSDKKNQANYYLWQDGNPLQENRVGYFVRACSDINEIEICTSDNDIFGVTVDSAGFIGAQSDVARDIKYGLVVTTGIVHVRCEQSVNVGDCVVSNNYGYAQKNDIGYTVAGRHQIDGIEYAEITLVTPISRICVLSDDVENLNERMDDAEINIAAAINLANAAYNKAGECDGNCDKAMKEAEEANKKAEEAVSNTNELDAEIAKAKEISAQAKALAESAIVSALSIRDEAVTAANNALADASELRGEFENKAIEMDGKLQNAADALEGVKEDIINTANDLQGNIDDAVDDIGELAEELEPLAAWPNAENPTGIAGFVAKANEDSATLASITKFEGKFGEALSGFISDATNENATVKAIATYQEKDANGNPTGNSGVSALIGQVDANKASIDALASLDGTDFSGLAGLTAQVTANKSSVTTLASHVVGDFENVDDWVEAEKDTRKVYYDKSEGKYYYFNNGRWNNTTKAYEAGLTGSLTGVQQIADDNKAQLDAMASYDTEGSSALAGLTAYVDENSAKLSTLAEYSNEDSGNSGIAGLVADVNANTSELNAVAQHSFTKDGDTTTGLAGLMAQVNDNTSEVSLVASRVAGKYVIISTPPAKDENWKQTEIYYGFTSSNKTDKLYYYYYNGNWQDGGSLWVTTFWNGVKDRNILDTSTVYYVVDTKKYWYYDTNQNTWLSTLDPYEAGLTATVAGIQVAVDENSSQINQLVSWSGETEESMANIEQKADENGASINLMVSSVDKYSVGEYSQAYGLTYEQAQSILKVGTIYIPFNHPNGETHTETYDGQEQSNDFTNGNYYEWDGSDWVESADKVVFANIIPTNSSGTYKYWYIDSTTAPSGYEAYALYIWETPTTGNSSWKKVNTLAGNVNNRITSMIRQKADSVALEVTNARGNSATLGARIGDTESEVQSLALWSKGGEENGTQLNLATIKQTADDAGSSIAQVAASVGGYTKVDSWSTSGKYTNKVYYNTSNNKYYYYKSGWKSTEDPIEAGLKVTAASIVTAINGDTTGITLNADHINLNGFVSANQTFTIDTTGYMTATGGTIGGWGIDYRSLYSKVSEGIVNGQTVYDGGVGFFAPTETSSPMSNPYFYAGFNPMKQYMVSKGVSQTVALQNKSKWPSTPGASDAGYIADGITKFQIERGGTVRSAGGLYLGYRSDLGDYSLKFDPTASTPQLEINGKIETNSGEIAGWYITENSIGRHTSNNAYSKTFISSSGSQSLYYSYNNIASDAKNDWLLWFGEEGTDGNGVQLGTKNGTIVRKGNFGVDRNGKLYASGATIGGIITATDGEIGGWTLASDQLYTGKVADNDHYYWVSFMRPTKLGSSGVGTDVLLFREYAGNRKNDADGYDDHLRINSDGTLTARKLQATGGNIGGWNIGTTSITSYDSNDVPRTILSNTGAQTAWYTYDGNSSHKKQNWRIWCGDGGVLGQHTDGKNIIRGYFGVDSSGKLYASSATISGTITATEGDIGGWNINEKLIETSETGKGSIYLASALTGDDYGNWIVAKDSSGNVKFKVSKTGIVTATDGEFTGTIKADSILADGIKVGNDGNTKFITSGDGSKWEGAKNLWSQPYIALLPSSNSTAITIAARSTTSTSNDCNINLYASDINAYGDICLQKSTKILLMGEEQNDCCAQIFSNEAITWFTTDQPSQILSIAASNNLNLISTNGTVKITAPQQGQIDFYAGSDIVAKMGYLTPANLSNKVDENKWGGRLYKNWYATNSITIVSDKNKKHSVATLPNQYSILFDNLHPVIYKYNDGTSDRLHTGFIAQEVNDAIELAEISTKDFGGLVILSPGTTEEEWGLRYEEFIALNTSEIQKLKARTTELENRVAELESQIKTLVNKE